MISGYPIWSLCSPASLAAPKVRTRGRTSIGLNSTKRAGAISGKGWKRPFDEPIPLPRGGPLVTLEDAGTYITKLPKAEHMTTEWQSAMKALILVATLGAPMMFARVGVMKGLNRHVEHVFGASRKGL
jgi:hypothetical protein